MKTYLTIEQSAELINIGVSVDKASSYEIVNYAIKPVFTLIDMFSIIPREIITEYPRRLHNLEIIWGRCSETVAHQICF